MAAHKNLKKTGNFVYAALDNTNRGGIIHMGGILSKITDAIASKVKELAVLILPVSKDERGSNDCHGTTEVPTARRIIITDGERILKAFEEDIFGNRHEIPPEDIKDTRTTDVVVYVKKGTKPEDIDPIKEIEKYIEVHEDGDIPTGPLGEVKFVVKSGNAPKGKAGSQETGAKLCVAPDTPIITLGDGTGKRSTEILLNLPSDGVGHPVITSFSPTASTPADQRTPSQRDCGKSAGRYGYQKGVICFSSSSVTSGEPYCHSPSEGGGQGGDFAGGGGRGKFSTSTDSGSPCQLKNNTTSSLPYPHPLGIPSVASPFVAAGFSCPDGAMSNTDVQFANCQDHRIDGLTAGECTMAGSEEIAGNDDSEVGGGDFKGSPSSAGDNKVSAGDGGKEAAFFDALPDGNYDPYTAAIAFKDQGGAGVANIVPDGSRRDGASVAAEFRAGIPERSGRIGRTSGDGWSHGGRGDGRNGHPDGEEDGAREAIA